MDGYKRIKAPSGPSSVSEQAMRNEPLRDMWRQNFWAYSRYVKRVLVDIDSWTVAMEVGPHLSFSAMGGATWQSEVHVLMRWRIHNDLLKPVCLMPEGRAWYRNGLSEFSEPRCSGNHLQLNKQRPTWWLRARMAKYSQRKFQGSCQCKCLLLSSVGR